MSVREHTIQQLDPLGALAGRPLTWIAAAGVPLVAVFLTWFNRDDVVSWPVAIAAIVTITVACVMLVRSSSSLRAPLVATNFRVIIGLGMIAYLLNAASMWGANGYIRDDWGPAVVGLLLMALAPYRTPSEVVIAGILSAILIGFVALLQAPTLFTDGPPVVFVIAAVAPELTLALASAAFSRAVVRGLERWSARARNAVRRMSDDSWIARSVQQDRITILNRDIVPFFTDVLSSGEIRESDRARALEISDAIRAVMVAEVDRSWLDGIVESSASGPLSATSKVIGGTVDDHDRLADAMSTDQRTALRAVIVAIGSSPVADHSHLRIAIANEHGRASASLITEIESGEIPVRLDFAPYFAVMRIVFPDFTIDFTHPTLTLRFTYELH